MLKRNISDIFKKVLSNLYHAFHIFYFPESQILSIQVLANQELWNEWNVGNGYNFDRTLTYPKIKFSFATEFIG